MGFWSEYYSTLLKGLTATTWKEKSEARRLVKSLKKEDHELYKKIREEVTTHHVTGALKDLERFITEVRKSAEIAEKFIFNALTQDRQILQAEKDILNALKELSQKAAKTRNSVIKKLERELALCIYQGSKDAEVEERGEYKIVMEILDEAHKGHKDWMEKIRMAFQDKQNQSYLTRWAIRGEITRETRDIKALKKVAKDIKKLVAKIQNEKKSDSKKQDYWIQQTLGYDYEQVNVALKDAFYQSYLIKKRDLLMFLKILFNLHTLRTWLLKWVEEHNLPRTNVDNIVNKIEGLEESIAKHFQPIAQGFRIVISSVNKIEKLALDEANAIS